MRRWMVGIVAAGMGLAGVMPAMAQTRPQVSGSESSHRTDATCLVNGADVCGGSRAGALVPGGPGPIIVGISPVLIPPVLIPAVIPAVIPGLGMGSGGHAGTDTDVDQSRHHGRELVR